MGKLDKIYKLMQEQDQRIPYQVDEVMFGALVLRWVIFGVALLLVLILGGMMGCPRYNVWQQGLQGEAELRRAEENRKITIEEARAEKESASFYMEAEVIRATGAAEANRIIDSSLTDNYLKYLWINGLHDGSSEVIYIPTETNLPILEATRKAPIYKTE